MHNCEYRFFQRPDDAIIRGYDKQAEIDLSSAGSFLSNYEPLDRDDATEEIEDAIRFGQYTEPMQSMIREFDANSSPDYYSTNANPRIVDGKPTKNPRYLQVRPDLRDQRSVYLADISSRSIPSPRRAFATASPSYIDPPGTSQQSSGARLRRHAPLRE